ncbi:MAG TPA: hypothetical protein VL379_13805 [Pseudomonadales bacterium]|nr:hypothetical protein [Pseudomonadales bacterium]
MDYVVSAMLLIVAIIHLLPLSGVRGRVGGYNAQVARVFYADVVALLCLVVGTVAYAIG